MNNGKFKVGVALSGGAARGLVHLGVLAALQEAGIPLDIVTGTSMGAIVGAMYATHCDCHTIGERVKAHLESHNFQADFLAAIPGWQKVKPQMVKERLNRFLSRGYLYSMSFTRPSLVALETFRQNIEALIEDIDIRDTKIKFACIALDLKSGREVLLTKGSLRHAVLASCALPGLFPPIPWEDYLLVDGGWVDNIPVKPARDLGAHVVLAFSPLEHPPIINDATSGMDVVIRADEVVRSRLNAHIMEEADFRLSFLVEDLPWHGFGQWQEFCERGKKQTEAQVAAIRNLIFRRRLRRWFLGC